MAQSSSRLSRHQARQSKKQLFIYLGIIVALIVLMLTFGSRIIEFIGNATYLIRGDEGNESGGNSISIVQAPSLDVLPEAVSSEALTVKGSVLEGGGTVELYLNDKKDDTERLSDETDFSFDVELSEGENEIRVKYVLNGEESDFSETQTVIFSKDKPKLENVSPSDGQTFKRGDERIEVSGVTDPNTTVTVNGFRAVVDQNGNFSYYLRLNQGDNQVTVVAKNEAGLEEKKEFKVVYSP